ncbi:MAG: hypothetical protein JWL87_378 [Candidatus Adlerbacteria bacterium]|nr:hypothetical protein [Candidatus Adlerbacteria bacterium]
MTKLISGIVGLCLAFLATAAQAQSPNNAPLKWSGTWAPTSTYDKSLLRNDAYQDYLNRHGIITGAPGSTGGSTVYNGDVVQQYTYTGPFSASHNTVIGNYSQNDTIITGNGNAVTNGTTQSANNATQSGTAKSNATTQGTGGVYNSADSVVTKSTP